MVQQPLISIITPLYNASKFIAKTIHSVQKQHYNNWEMLIVDDASTDNSTAIVETFILSDARLKLTKLSVNNGAAFCRNIATQMAAGDYIAFLDSDDLWHPEKLEKQLKFMQDTNCNVSFTSYQQIDEDGKLLNKRIVALSKLSYRKQHRNNYIGNLTGIYNASVLGKIAAPNIRKRQDWAVWLEAIKKSGKPAMGMQEDLAFYRLRKDSMSSKKVKLLKYNFSFYREYLGYSWIKSMRCLFRFLFEYFVIRPKYIQKIEEN